MNPIETQGDEVTLATETRIVSDIQEESIPLNATAIVEPEDLPDPPISYPLKVIYCGNCGLPPEYCEYFPDYENCRKWIEAHLPTELGALGLCDSGGEEKKGRQKRGGKGLVKAKKPAGKTGPKKICLSRAPRGKKKSVTVVVGLGTFGIELKTAAKFLSTRFACGAAPTGEDEIIIQGDVKDDLFHVLPDKWPEIDEDCIHDLGDQKR